MLKKYILAMALVSATLATAQAADFALKVDEKFNEDWIEWDGGIGRAYDFRWDARLKDGQVAICGAGQFLDVTSRSATLDLLRKASVVMDGRVILKDLSFFARYKKGDQLSGATANCRNTGAKPANGDSGVELQIRGRARF